MQNYNGKQKKKGFSLGNLIFVLLFLTFFLADEVPDEVIGGMFLLCVLMIVIWAVVKFSRLGKRAEAANTHSHDRIDHRQDIKINPKTGRPVRAPIRYNVQHSPREHWKQQLDGLLANGTIDRAEYNAMMNRRF